MAKYPLISGHTNISGDAATSLNLRTEVGDSWFDVYKYMNPGANDNAQRASIVVIIKNAAIAGSGTELGIRRIAVRRNGSEVSYPVFATMTSSLVPTGANINTPVEGWNLGPRTAISNLPFIGAPNDFVTGDNNKVVSAISNLDTDTHASGATGFIQVPTEGNILSSTLTSSLSSGTSGKVIPVYNPTYLTSQAAPFDGTVFDNGIPDNSYAAFILAYQPTEALPLDSSYDLIFETTAGNIKLDLNVQAFNEIIMSGTVGSISGDTFTPSGTIVNDRTNWLLGANNNGCYPSTKTAAQLQTQVGDNVVLRVEDGSSLLGGAWKWTNSYNETGTYSPEPDNGPMSPTSDSWNADSGALSGLLASEVTWAKVTGAENMDGEILSGASGGALSSQAYNTLAIYKNFTFEGSVGYHTGTKDISGLTQNNANYLKNTFFLFRSLHVQYDAEDYDANAYGNEWYSFGFSYGVYARVTTTTSMPSIGAALNITTPGSGTISTRTHASTTTGSNYFLQNGGEIPVIKDIRWNNWSNQNSTAYNGKISSFNWQDNIANAGGNAGSTYFRLKSDFGPSRVPKYTGTVSNSVTTEPASFSDFDTIADTTDRYFKWSLKAVLNAQALYGDIETSRFFDKDPAFELPYGFHPISYYSDSSDKIWNNAEDADYPGLLGGNLYFNLIVGPRLSYLSFIPKDNATTTDSGGGSVLAGNNAAFGEDFDCDITAQSVTQWRNLDGSAFNNTPIATTTVIGGDASQSPANSATPKVKFSGMDGAVIKKGTTSTDVDFDHFTNTISSSWSSGGTTTQVNSNHRGLIDSAGNAIPKFKPSMEIMDLGIAQLSVVDGNYYAYGSFRLWNNGDDVVYIHSLNTYNADIIEIQTTLGSNDVNGLANAGYKPNASTSQDAQMFISSGRDASNAWNFSGATATYGGLYTSKKYHHGSEHSDFTSGGLHKMKEFYRGGGNASRYVSPQRKYTDLADGSPSYTQFTGDDAGGFTVPDWAKIGGGDSGGVSIFKGTQEYEGSAGTSQANGNNPWGDSLFHVCIKVDPAGDLNDFGVYRKKLEIISYTDDWSNRKETASGSASTGILDSSQVELNVSNIIFKATIAASPILKIEDPDGYEFPGNTTVNLGSLNVG